MTAKIFKNYVLWFDRKMADRQMILLIDGFPVYYARIILLQEEFL